MSMILRKSTCGACMLAVIFAFGAIPTYAADTDATVVQLRTSCQENGNPIANCFTTTASLQTWMTSQRATNAGPLVVNIGAGTFDPFSCSDSNDISLKGSGRGVTVMSSPQFGLTASNCFNFHVQDLTLSATDLGFSFGVFWTNEGTSTWDNVEVVGGVYGWSEQCSDSQIRPVHRWFSSEIRSKRKTAYSVGCSENWLTGSEITAEGSGLSGELTAISVRKQEIATVSPEIHVYGSVIRVIASDGAEFVPPEGTSSVNSKGMIAVFAGTEADVHIHGTGIDVLGNHEPNDVAALLVANGGMIHANQSSYVMRTAAPGKEYRLKNDGGMLMAPYQWESNVLQKTLVSVDGADTTYELVPDPSGASRPRTLSYSSTCNGPGGPWFDVATQTCR